MYVEGAYLDGAMEREYTRAEQDESDFDII